MTQQAKAASTRLAGSAALVLACPLLPGQQEAWRRFTQEMLGARRDEHEESRRRLGITRELAWLLPTPCGDLVIVYLEAAEPAQVLPALAASALPYDRWFRRQVRDFHGLDLAQPPAGSAPELVLTWPAP